MTGPFDTTIAALRDIRAEHWDLDACYAFDRLIEAAQSLNNGAPYFNADPARMAKIEKHIKRIAQGINATYRREHLTPREIEIMDMDARSERTREEMRG
jgi:DNA-binding NarL/FixJ family response regulator